LLGATIKGDFAASLRGPNETVAPPVETPRLGGFALAGPARHGAGAGGGLEFAPTPGVVKVSGNQRLALERKTDASEYETCRRPS